MNKILGLRVTPYDGNRQLTWRDYIPSASYTGQRWFPSMNYLGAPLLGRTVYVDGKPAGLNMLPLFDAALIFLEMLEVIEESKQWRDLLVAVVYRRQLTERDCMAVDAPLLRLACRARPRFTSVEWGMLLERMPPHTRIHALISSIVERHRFHRQKRPMLIAAE